MYADIIVKLIASFIEQDIISREYYDIIIHPLVQDMFKTFDVEDTCKQVWLYIVKDEYDAEMALLTALAEQVKPISPTKF